MELPTGPGEIVLRVDLEKTPFGSLQLQVLHFATEYGSSQALDSHFVLNSTFSSLVNISLGLKSPVFS